MNRLAAVVTASTVMAVTAAAGLVVRAMLSEQDHPKLSPYPALRWEGSTPQVLVGEQWYTLRAIDDVTAVDILAHCRARHPSRVRKRFAEDIVQVLAEMGHDVGDTVELTLEDGEHRVVVMEHVPMTRGNRQAIMEGGAGRGRPDAPIRRVARAHAAEIDPRFRFLATTFDELVAASSRPPLSRERAAEDLDQLEFHLESQHAYLELTGVDHRAALDAIRASLPDRTSVESFTLQLTKLIALLGDAHARVDGPPPPDARYLTFLVGDTGHGPVAFAESRTRLRDERRPWLASIDGLPVGTWLDAASRFVPNTSASWVRRNSIRQLRYLSVLRRELGLPETEHAVVEYTDGAGDTAEETIVRLGEQRRIYGNWPETGSSVLPGNIGYLRVPSMRERVARASRAMMHEFRETAALVIDVRGNTGGTREVLRSLFPYFMSGDEPPCVASVAAYRLAPWFRPDHLAARYMHDRAWDGWTEAQRGAIDAFAEGFEPQWPLPAGKYSPWHYLVLDRALDADAFHYDRPVVILMNEDCFSATDVFLGAFKGRPGVTLMGTASGGGSGFSHPIELAHSRISVRLSSMASFQPTGALYDGNGIAPDVVVHATAAYYLGQADPQLDAAVAFLVQETSRKRNGRQ